MEWSIHDVAALTGITSRTLRHYADIGLLRPTRIGAGGYRNYDTSSLVRLQRILLLRELGLRLPTIAEVLDGTVDDVQALTEHVRLLEQERARIDSQIRSVQATIHSLRKGKQIMAETMFDGFDYTHYRDEVAERWGKETSEKAEMWWHELGHDGQRGFLAQHHALQDAYDAALSAGAAPTSERVQQIAAQHYEWIVRSWQGKRPDADALTGLTTMYVNDPRFARNYTRADPAGAEYVRDALLAYAATHLTGSAGD